MKNEEIKLFIGKILDCSIDRVELARFINGCIGISRSILSTMYWKQLAHFIKSGYTPTSVACRCIEKLFLPRNGITCYELHRFFSAKWEDLSLVPVEEVTLTLHHLLRNKLSQQFSELYGELDPQYKKILRNIHVAINKSGGFRLLQHVKGTYMHRASEAKLSLELPSFPLDALLQELMQHARAGDDVPDLVDKIFLILRAQSSYRRALLVSDITAVIRDFYFIHYRHFVEAEGEEQPEAHDEKLFLDILRRLSRETVAVIEKTVLCNQIHKSKITSADSGKLTQAMQRYLEDICQKETKSLFEYYVEQFPETTHAKYRTVIRKRFEYLMARTKEEFIARCKTYFRQK